MPINDRIRCNSYILREARKAEHILGDSSRVRELLVSASSKAEYLSGRLTSVKRDLETLGELLVFWMKGEYREIPWTSLMLAAAAVLYFVNPFDAIPDILPATGFLDDASVIGFVLASIKNDIENFRKWQSAAGSTEDILKPA
jgi:uncharacterized membrane protein YkvA (DUF1232 family)